MKTQRGTGVKEILFLTRREVLRAIHMDFQQYAPQIDTWRKISPMVLGDDTRLVEDGGRQRLWLVKGRKQRRRPIQAKDLGALLLRRLETSDPSLVELAGVCQIIFQTNVRAGPSRDGRIKGLHIETGMEDFHCQKCGKCCRNLDYHDQLNEKDYALWQQLGRQDLLQWVRPVHAGGRIHSYRIWVPPGSVSAAAVCPWLRRVGSGEEEWQCAIHDVKPEICRQYPGTRKHALMTGCPGFNLPEKSKKERAKKERF